MEITFEDNYPSSFYVKNFSIYKFFIQRYTMFKMLILMRKLTCHVAI